MLAEAFRHGESHASSIAAAAILLRAAAASTLSAIAFRVMLYSAKRQASTVLNSYLTLQAMDLSMKGQPALQQGSTEEHHCLSKPV